MLGTKPIRGLLQKSYYSTALVQTGLCPDPTLLNSESMVGRFPHDIDQALPNKFEVFLLR